MPRFVILSHDHPFPHWDLMLEVGSVLRTWRLREIPRPGQAVLAESLGDHRIAYLDYEGPVSGGRGRVVRWDAGTFDLIAEGTGFLRMKLVGQKLCGEAGIQQHSDGQLCFLLGDDIAGLPPQRVGGREHGS